MLKSENLNRIAYLDTLKKKPFDLLLELIEIEAFSYEFTEKKSVSSSEVHLQNVLEEKYKLFIPEFLLDKWILGNFDLKNSKLVLKNGTEELSRKIADIKDKEEDFLQKMNKIKSDFINFAMEKFNKKIDNEQARRIFDSYIYSAANSRVLNKFNEISNEFYFIFQEFLKYLMDNDNGKLSVIENFGVANQIQDLILYDNRLDKNFLEGCYIFLDTPILMRRLGYDGKRLYDDYKKFLDSLINSGAQECIFEHTFDEIWGILFNFKRCIALNILNAKGVGTFLEARKEFSDADEVLTLDKNLLRENIEKLGVKFIDAIDADENNTLNSDYDAWDFDEKMFVKILKEKSAIEDFCKSWVERDTNSISAIHRMRSKDHIEKIDTYKDGKYYLLIDNYILISALKEYYKQKDLYSPKNELLLENTILFQLWQQFDDKDDIIRSLFRSKCFAMNTIDDDFRDRLYKNARRLEAYDPDSGANSSVIIDNPNFEREIYSDVIKNGKFDDDAYISSNYKKRILTEKEKIKDEIRQNERKLNEERTSKNEILSQNQKLVLTVKELSKENAAVKKTVETDIEKVAKLLKTHMSLTERIKVFFKKIFDKNFNEDSYFSEKANLFLKNDDV
ncbi:MAG: hypothetical protein HDR36_01145 [Treponema sp.]|nr:hypothetical protein [Treponema sp.]